MGGVTVESIYKDNSRNERSKINNMACVMMMIMISTLVYGKIDKGIFNINTTLFPRVSTKAF